MANEERPPDKEPVAPPPPPPDTQVAPPPPPQDAQVAPPPPPPDAQVAPPPPPPDAQVAPPPPPPDAQVAPPPPPPDAQVAPPPPPASDDAVLAGSFAGSADSTHADASQVGTTEEVHRGPRLTAVRIAIAAGIVILVVLVAGLAFHFLRGGGSVSANPQEDIVGSW